MCTRVLHVFHAISATPRPNNPRSSNANRNDLTFPTVKKDEVKAIRNAKNERISPRNANADELVPSAVDLLERLEPVIKPLTLLLLSQFLLFIGVGAVIPSIPLYAKELGLSSTANGIIISAPALILFLLAKPFGALADRGRKPAMIIGMAVIALSDFGTAVSTTLPFLLLSRLGLGAGRGLSEAGERGMIADYANAVPAVRGKILAGQQACVALGIAIGAPLGGVVVERYGIRAAFLCVTGAALVALGCYLFLPETAAGAVGDGGGGVAGARRGEVTNGNDDDNESDSDESLKWGTLLRQPQWRGIALCQMGSTFGYAAKISSVPIIATQILPGGAVGAGTLLSLAGLTGLVGAPLGGFLTDRFGARNAVMVSGVVAGVGLFFIPFVLLDSAAAAAAAAAADVSSVVVWNDTSLYFSSLVLLWSLGATAQGPAMTAVAQELAPKGREATAMALPRAAGDGMYIVAPILLGLVADYGNRAGESGGVECAFAAVALLLGVGALFWLGRDSN
eukprot:CAMPEP_0172485212 /NCGR_PEP_ID=MMETSP1066-20121228/13130_1 /TAXON_ID=671091 /ORGANISM="Coscinodiscus wailesii, Strain CCMP2513" /LENGTH=509 /DNA_ID=CAMNT_0013250295 /DNA_START=142 /DNA_END=1672 /DNA_ORIENTATION=-